MTRLFLLTFLIIGQFIYGQQSLKQLTNKYTPYLTELNQGIGVLIKKNETIETANIGNNNFNKHTVFNIGSATKKITAILILQEIEKGTLKLSDSIGTYLNTIPNVNPNLTIETLLRHKSGLGELVGDNYESDFFAKNDSVLNRDLLQHIPKNNPKKIGKHSYCNTNYILLGKLLEKVTDKNYFDLLRERIFIPCEMTASYPYVSKNLKNLAPPTHKGENILEYLDHRFYANYAYAAGSIASTLNDISKFYHHLFEKNTLITKESLQKLTDFDSANYSLGMTKLEGDFIGHGGNNMGYSFREFYNPKTKNLILFFSNSKFIPFNKILKKELFNYLKGENIANTFYNNVAKNYKQSIGKYLLEYNGMKLEMEIIEKNNHLYFSAQGNELLLISKTPNKLYDGTIGIELEIKNKNELIYRQNGFESVIKRIKT